MKQTLQIIYSVYAWTVISVTTILSAISIILVSVLLRPFDPDRRAAGRVAYLWGLSIIAANPTWKLKIQGRGYIREGKGYVLVANHMSFGDIICLYCIERHFKWVAKESLFSVPFFGWAMSALGYIPLRRGEHGSIRDSFRQSIGWLNREMSVLIFPEGTRSVTGKMGAFKNGAFKLAIQTKRPIVPIVLTGTRDAIKKGSMMFAVTPRCKMKVLKPIPTAGYRENQFAELRDLVRSKMLEAAEG